MSARHHTGVPREETLCGNWSCPCEQGRSILLWTINVKVLCLVSRVFELFHARNTQVCAMAQISQYLIGPNDGHLTIYIWNMYYFSRYFIIFGRFYNLSDRNAFSSHKQLSHMERECRKQNMNMGLQRKMWILGLFCSYLHLVWGINDPVEASDLYLRELSFLTRNHGTTFFLFALSPLPSPPPPTPNLSGSCGQTFWSSWACSLNKEACGTLCVWVAGC